MTNVLPATCRHVAVDPDSRELAIATGPVPSPGDDAVLIRVHAAGLNRADLLQRAGLYPPPEDASPILGLEVAGVVAAVGRGAGEWRVGDRICALTHGGGYAEYAVAPIGQCFPIPAGYSDAEAAALPEALFTIWHNVFQRGALQAGERILIHGGASGMGTMGIMMSRAAGAEVYATAGSDSKCRTLEQLGATRAINYREQDFEAALGELGLAGRIDVILDMIGGDYVQKNMNVAAPGGRIVNIAYMNGFKATVNFAPLLLKRLTLTGSTLRAQSFAQKAAMAREIRAQVYPHLHSGAVRPVVDSTFALADVAQAHARMQGNAHTGKIVLTTGAG